MIRTTPAVLLAAALAAPALAQVVVGPVVNPANGHRYYRLAANNFAGAVAAADAMGAKLVTIHDAATNAWVRTNVAAAAPAQVQCMIGLNDAAAEGLFTWSGGDPLVYTNWGAGEPNNFNNEDAAAMNVAAGTWNDVPSTFFVQPIVEIDGAIRVPAEYPTIQAAINAAVNGQTILVAPGVYDGSLNYGLKKLTVRSESGPLQTTIRTDAAEFGIVIDGGQGAETSLEGFTITPRPGVGTNYALFIGGVAVRGCRIGGFGLGGITAYRTAVISDCLIAGNGQVAIHIWAVNSANASDVRVQNCTLAGGRGAAIQSDSTVGFPAVTTVANSVILGFASAFTLDARSAVRVSYSDVQGGWPGAGNINADPMFADAPGGDGFYSLTDDYSLSAGSPCIDAGSNAARVAAGLSTTLADANNNGRFVDDTSVAGAAAGAVVDMGALEFQGTSCLIDFNHDGFVDFFDYDDFVAAFESGC